MKIFEKMAYNQMIEFLHFHNIIQPNQSGFCNGDPTTAGALKVSEQILGHLKNCFELLYYLSQLPPFFIFVSFEFSMLRYYSNLRNKT